MPGRVIDEQLVGLEAVEDGVVLSYEETGGNHIQLAVVVFEQNLVACLQSVAHLLGLGYPAKLSGRVALDADGCVSDVDFAPFVTLGGQIAAAAEYFIVCVG